MYLRFLYLTFFILLIFNLLLIYRLMNMQENLNRASEQVDYFDNNIRYLESNLFSNRITHGEYINNYEGYDLKADIVTLKSFFDNNEEFKLVIKYSPLSCKPCIDSVLFHLKIIDQIPQNTIILSYFNNINELRLASFKNIDGFNYLAIPLLDIIHDPNSYAFIIDNELRIINSFSIEEDYVSYLVSFVKANSKLINR